MFLHLTHYFEVVNHTYLLSTLVSSSIDVPWPILHWVIYYFYIDLQLFICISQTFVFMASFDIWKCLMCAFIDF